MVCVCVYIYIYIYIYVCVCVCVCVCVILSQIVLSTLSFPTFCIISMRAMLRTVSRQITAES